MNSNFRRITINLSQLEDTNFFGSTVDEIDDLKPKWFDAASVNAWEIVHATQDAE